MPICLLSAHYVQLIKIRYKNMNITRYFTQADEKSYIQTPSDCVTEHGLISKNFIQLRIRNYELRIALAALCRNHAVFAEGNPLVSGDCGSNPKGSAKPTPQ
jgi:hypothetical protein